MVAIDEDKTTIHITRGDTTIGEINNLAFYFPILNTATGEVENYKFKPTDKITFIIMQKKGYTKYEVLRKTYYLKDIGYTEETEYPTIPLTAEETKCFETANKKKTYWYDLVLNDTITILGYDDEGPKKIIAYPEGGE